MGRAPCCDKSKVKRGPWSPEEDSTLRKYVEKHGTAAGSWIALPQKAGLKRCGKSCRLRWLNYLRPNIKHGGFTQQEDSLILSLYHTIGSRWSVIASQLPGRTDNDVKNHWNTKLKKRLPTCFTYNDPHTASTSATTSVITSTNTININSDEEFDNKHMLPYFPLNDHHSYHYQHQQILDPLPALLESPENDLALLPSAPPPTLSPPLISPDNIHANATTNGLCHDYDAFLLQLDCGFMPYDVIFDFHDKFNQQFTHFTFGYSPPSTVSNAAQEQHTIYQTFTY